MYLKYTPRRKKEKERERISILILTHFRNSKAIFFLLLTYFESKDKWFAHITLPALHSFISFLLDDGIPLNMNIGEASFLPCSNGIMREEQQDCALPLMKGTLIKTETIF